MSTKLYKRGATLLAIALTCTFIFSGPAPTDAADHADAPLANNDRPADLADTYAFLDPNDNTRVILAMTFVGFIVPAEQVNQGFFDHRVRYRFELEETGDARADRFIDITFSQQTSRTMPQTATIVLPDGRTTITAPTTVPTLADTPPTPTVTTNATTGVAVFAGVVDDPFFFDIIGFGRFVASVLAGTPNVSQLSRGRDSFAGYNTQAIALSIPMNLLNFSNDVIGVNATTSRQAKTTVKKNGSITNKGPFRQIDRGATPGVNTVFIPFARKDEFNRSSGSDDAAGAFATDIVAVLTALGTDETNIGILASVAVAQGDYLRLNRTTANMGDGGGNNAGAGFPNGRRLSDDVIDTILFFVANQNTLGDSVPANDVPFRNTFPFFGASQQPRMGGTADDNTRN